MKYRNRIYLLFILCLILSFKVNGQNSDQKIPISQALDQISEVYSVVFNYESSILEGITVSPFSSNFRLTTAIKNLESQSGLIFQKLNASVYIIFKPVRVCGYIVDLEAQQPLIGATIVSSLTNAVSDESGFFEIHLKSLNDKITIRHLGYKTIERAASYFQSDKCGTVHMILYQEVISPVLIETYLVKGIDKKQDWTTSIDYSQFSLLPGLTESDVLQTVQALPSIMSVDETVSNINIRGGSNDQNLILWDGIKMYQTGHFFGLISSFNPNMTQTASIINNGTDASLTDGVSGTIIMETEKNINSKFNGIAGVNFLNAELFSNIPIGSKSSIQISSRKSLNKWLNTPTYNVYFDRIAQQTEAINNMPNVSNSNKNFDFYDASLRWLYRPNETDLLRLNFILINNNLGFDETANFDGALRTRRSNVSQNSLALGLNYRRQWSDKFYSTFNIYNNEYKLEANNADILNNQLQLQENRVSESSILLNNFYNQNNWQFNIGYQFTETEVIDLNDIDLPRFVRRDEEILREHGAFGQVKFIDNYNDFSFRAGLRANYLTRFEKFILEPRLSIRKSIGEYIELEALGEFKHQSTSQIVNFQNDFLGIEKRRWQLADNENIPILMSKQASFGLVYANKGWLIDAKGYFKSVDGITTQSQGFTTKYEFAREQGTYDVYGLEILLRKKIVNLSSWISYSYMDNSYTFNTLDEITFPNNFDITHSFTVGSTYSNKSWDISAGLNYRSGKPTSVPAEDNEIINGFINFENANSERLTHYLRLDASSIYKLDFSPAVRSEIGISFWNILDKENTINNYYRIGENEMINKFSRLSLGFTYNVVFRLYF